MAEYMIVKDSIIEAVYCGDIGDNENYISLPDNHEVRVGENIAFYNDDWKRKSEVELISQGLIEMPAGFKIENNKLIEMSYDEKIIIGLEQLPANMKIVDGQIVPKTAEEIFSEKNEEEKAAYIRMQRDSLINEADTILLKYQEQVELGITVQDDTYKLALLQYKENLRNIPEQKGFPENVVWPELPIKEE